MTKDLIFAFAPMKGFSQIYFLKILKNYGFPDLFFTEFSRVHGTSDPESHILDLVEKESENCKIVVQLMGNEPEKLAFAAKQWIKFPIVGIDLNLGCPVSRIYKKDVGGGLLKKGMRNLQTIDMILGRLRDAIGSKQLSVKTRIGFDDSSGFEERLELFNKHKVDLVTLHPRKVSDLYKNEPDYKFIKIASEKLECTLLANGDILSVKKAKFVLDLTKCGGVMIGRSAIRNPWIFNQLKAFREKKEICNPKFLDVRKYIDDLNNNLSEKISNESKKLGLLKGFTNFVAQGIDSKGEFLKNMRLSQTVKEFFEICDKYLLKNPDFEISAEPFPLLFAMPNKECPDYNKTKH